MNAFTSGAAYGAMNAATDGALFVHPAAVKSSPYQSKYFDTRSLVPSTFTLAGLDRKVRVLSSSSSPIRSPSYAQDGSGAQEREAQLSAKWRRGSRKNGRSRRCSISSSVRSKPPTRCRFSVQTPGMSRIDATPGCSRIERTVQAL